MLSPALSLRIRNRAKGRNGRSARRFDRVDHWPESSLGIFAIDNKQWARLEATAFRVRLTNDKSPLGRSAMKSVCILASIKSASNHWMDGGWSQWRCNRKCFNLKPFKASKSEIIRSNANSASSELRQSLNERLWLRRTEKRSTRSPHMIVWANS